MYIDNMRHIVRTRWKKAEIVCIIFECEYGREVKKRGIVRIVFEHVRTRWKKAEIVCIIIECAYGREVKKRGIVRIVFEHVRTICKKGGNRL